ncbi:MAG: DUF2232 domain-containing protein [Desulfuromonadaceae bacterium]|nr:DUF2232 domain-containing protein [Desulfuromonadaceae bacterium]
MQPLVRPGGNSFVTVLISSLIAVGLLLSTAYLGPMGALLHLLLVAPAAYAGMRHGLIAGLFTVLVIAGMQLALSTPVSMVLYLFQFGVPALVLVFSLRRGTGWPVATLQAVVASLGLLAALGLWYAGSHETTLTAVVQGYIDHEISQAQAVYDQAGMDAAQVEEIMAFLERSARFLRQAFVGIAIVALSVVDLVAVMLLSHMGRGNYYVPGTAFRHFKLNEWLVWLLIVAGFGLLVPADAVKWSALNLLTVLLPLYFLQGAAIVTYFLKKKAFSTLSQVFTYVIMLAVNPLPAIVTALGVFDLWFDFRKPRVKTT